MTLTIALWYIKYLHCLSKHTLFTVQSLEYLHDSSQKYSTWCIILFIFLFLEAGGAELKSVKSSNEKGDHSRWSCCHLPFGDRTVLLEEVNDYEDLREKPNVYTFAMA